MLLQLSVFHSFLEKWKSARQRAASAELPPVRRPPLPSSPVSAAHLLSLLMVMACLPGRSCAVTYHVGIVGPWSCDPLYAKAQPRLAARLATDRIRADASLSLPVTFEPVILEEDCQTSLALSDFLASGLRVAAFVGPLNPGYCEAASLLGHSWNKAVFSWACTNPDLDVPRRHPAFVRTLPSAVTVLLGFLRHFRWARVAVLSAPEEGWVETANQVASTLRGHGLPVALVASVGRDPTSMRYSLASVQRTQGVRVVLLCMHSALIGGTTQKLLLETAHDMRMTRGSLVFVPYDTLLYSLPYRNVYFRALRNSSKLLRAYDAVLTVTVESQEVSFYEAYQEAVDHGDIPAGTPEQASPLFGTIYDSIMLMAYSMQSLHNAGEWPSGAGLAHHAQNLAFDGFSQRIRTGSSGAALLEYVLLDTDGRSWELYPTHRFDVEADMVRSSGRVIHFPVDVSPKADNDCWFTQGTICAGGEKSFLDSVVCASLLIVALGLLNLHYSLRQRTNQNNLARGRSKIVLKLEDVTFIHPSLSNTKLSQGTSRTSDIQKSISEAEFSLKSAYTVSTITPATLENSNVAVCEGEWVWLHRLPNGNFSDISTATTNIFDKLRAMRHENMNPFIGFFHDCGVFAIVTEFCSRGTLEDLLYKDDITLDWMFVSSLLLDLIKGMKYLHHKGVCHGRLKSRNCLVDGRFVLKVTDYSYNQVMEAQKFPYKEPPAEELLWTAPEILRGPTPGLKGSPQGDVYSFSIVVQEVVMRGPPFCMMDQPAEELIQKVRKPPPLCRPVVTSDTAPLECIELMKQCWNELPERRPTFDQIFNKFKDINKGKKTNIIDSMLHMLEQYSSNLEELIKEQTQELEMEKQKTEKLLTQMLPLSVAKALKLGYTVEPEQFDNVTVYFSDIVGFTSIAAKSEPIEVVDVLNDLYSLFDGVICNHDIYKVETIGDAYMVASGLPVRNGDRHAAEISNMALDILSAMGTFKMKHMPNVPVLIRIGVHSGSCVAGVVGLTMPRYCLFGATVNTASLMEATGMPYRIHISHSTVQLLQEMKAGYQVQLRTESHLTGTVMENTYWLTGKDGFTKPLPLPPDSGVEMSKDFRLLLKRAVRRLSHVRCMTQLNLGDDSNVMMHHH